MEYWSKKVWFLTKEKNIINHLLLTNGLTLRKIILSFYGNCYKLCSIKIWSESGEYVLRYVFYLFIKHSFGINAEEKSTKKTFSLSQRNIFLICGQRKTFFEIKKVLSIKKIFFLIQWNRFVYIKENFFESTKLSSIQRNFFFDCKCFLDSKKLFSEWGYRSAVSKYPHKSVNFCNFHKIFVENQS